MSIAEIDELMNFRLKKMPCKAEIKICVTEMRSKAALQDAINGFELWMNLRLKRRQNLYGFMKNSELRSKDAS